MKYETRNAIGLTLLVVGSLIAIIGLLVFGRTLAIIVAVIGVVALAIGLYMMTRGFTEADRDHPDYKQYRKRFHGEEE